MRTSQQVVGGNDAYIETLEAYAAGISRIATELLADRPSRERVDLLSLRVLDGYARDIPVFDAPSVRLLARGAHERLYPLASAFDAMWIYIHEEMLGKALLEWGLEERSKSLVDEWTSSLWQCLRPPASAHHSGRSGGLHCTALLGRRLSPLRVISIEARFNVSLQWRTL